MAKILITNAWHDDNKGDSGIVLAIMELFSSERENDFCILSEFSNNDSRFKNAFRHILKRFPKTEILSSPWPLFPVKKKYDDFIIVRILRKIINMNYPNIKVKRNMKVIIPLLKYFKNKLDNNCSIPPNDLLKKVEKKIQECDLIISKGGSFIYSDGTDEGNLRLVRIVFILYLAQLYKKRVIIFGQSIWGLHDEFVKKIMMPFLKNATIFTRESISQKYLKLNLGVDSTVIPDPAFYLSKFPKMELPRIEILDEYLSDGYVLIGLTVREWRFKTGNNDFKGSILQILEILKTKFNKIKFVFVPQVIGPVYLEDDRNIMKEIYNSAEIHLQENIILFFDDYSPYALKYIYSKFNVMIGTRLHSLIFALTENIPSIAISYSPHKHIGVMSMIGLQDYVFPIKDIVPEDIVNKLIIMINNREKFELDIKKKVISFQRELEKTKEVILTDNNTNIKINKTDLNWINTMIENYNHNLGQK